MNAARCGTFGAVGSGPIDRRFRIEARGVVSGRREPGRGESACPATRPAVGSRAGAVHGSPPTDRPADGFRP